MNSTWGCFGHLQEVVKQAQRLASEEGEVISVWDVDSRNPEFEMQGKAKCYWLATCEARSRCPGICVAEARSDGSLWFLSDRLRVFGDKKPENNE